MKRVLLCLLLLLLVVLVPNSSMAAAYDGSLLAGKTVTSSWGPCGTASIFDTSDYSGDQMWNQCGFIFDFDAPTDVKAWRWKADFGYNMSHGYNVDFYDEAGTKIKTLAMVLPAATEWTNIEPILGVKKVVFSYVSANSGFTYYIDLGSKEIPLPPSNVQINSYVALHDRVTLNFSGLNVNEFDIYRDGSLIGTVPAASGSGMTTYAALGLTPETSYQFYVVGRNFIDQMASSVINVRTAVQPPPPTLKDFQVFEVLDKSIRLSFSFLNANHYEIFRNGEKVTELPGNATSYVLATEPSTDYQVWVVGVNDFGRTASNIIDVTTQEELVLPSDPVLAVAGVYVDRVDLSVSVKKAKTIKFYRDNRLINTISGDVKSYTDNTVEADREYTYKYIAQNSLGSVTSPELKVKTLRPPVTDVPTVFLTPGTKSFIDSMRFTVSSNDPDASLFYSFDGEDWLPYSSPVLIKDTTDVYAKAVNVLGAESSVVVNRYSMQENPKVQLGVDLDDVTNAGERHFNVLWPIIAFCAGIVGAFVYGRRIRDMFMGG